MSAQGDLELNLIELIGEVKTRHLCEQFGGTRLLIPANPHPDHRIASTIGMRATFILSENFAPDVLNIPVARGLRAKHYRNLGWSNARIATALGLTEGGVLRLLKKMNREAPE
ncbi:hypothetical protein [Sphingomonas panni]|uniref:hypothetical protein n=1 Tax=Sphingomonas panni TaxID=237612 RepID=UPI001F5BB491|nr:hypothetical protein [Sphingomonas panni]